MEKVKCANCGNIGYTASPESVRCSECGLNYYVIVPDDNNDNTVSIETARYMYGLAAGNIEPERFLSRLRSRIIP
ncbi:MAG: hypothetical protein WCV56_05815 [Candidatus Omnitrophota bacterium]